MSGTTSKLIVANWKMNGVSHEALPLVNAIVDTVSDSSSDIVVCPPFTLLGAISTLISSSDISLGAQDCHHETHGAYTGNISAPMLKDCGCSYVIVGHSERRQYHHETNNQVKLKAEAALEAGLTPIICVGETHEQRAEGLEISVITEQVTNSVPADHDSIVIAYEPVWAIGTGNIPNATQITEIHRAIKDVVSAPVLYGGSVKPSNAGEILPLDGVDGLLVGGASLNAGDFAAIVGS